MYNIVQMCVIAQGEKLNLNTLKINWQNYLHIGPACAKGLEGKNEGTAIQGEILRNSGSKGR